MEAKLDMVLEQVGRDKNIDKSVLINALEQAILTAAKRTFGMNREMEAKFNLETGSVDLFLIVNVVEEDDAIEGREITVEQARSAGLEAELGDELLFQVFYRTEDSDRAGEQDEKFGTLIDLKAEEARLQKELAKTTEEIARLHKKLSNERFVANAPEEIVAAEREKLAEFVEAQSRLQLALARVRDAG